MSNTDLYDYCNSTVRLIKPFSFSAGAIDQKLLENHKGSDFQKYCANVFHTVKHQTKDRCKSDSLWPGKMKFKW